jgi:hypothetical protein
LASENFIAVPVAYSALQRRKREKKVPVLEAIIGHVILFRYHLLVLLPQNAKVTNKVVDSHHWLGL